MIASGLCVAWATRHDTIRALQEPVRADDAHDRPADAEIFEQATRPGIRLALELDFDPSSVVDQPPATKTLQVARHTVTAALYSLIRWLALVSRKRAGLRRPT